MEIAVGLIFFVGLVLLAGLLSALVAWSRRNRSEREALAASQSPPPPPRSISGRERSDREVRTGARHLSTDPESDEARALKQQLTEAVSDLADEVEELPERRLTSDEMITQAKQRIRERTETPGL